MSKKYALYLTPKLPLTQGLIVGGLLWLNFTKQSVVKMGLILDVLWGLCPLTTAISK